MIKKIITTTVFVTLAFSSGLALSHVEKNQQSTVESASLEKILDSMPQQTQARFNARHPKQTLTFFGIKPGMKVIEALPGGGWYSKILLPYLGEKGQLIGADYAIEMYPKFGFFDQQQLDKKKTWVSDWTQQAETWRTKNSASVSAFHLGKMPESLNASVDAVLFIRALHNLARFESDGGYLTKALNDTYNALKPGGIVGIVQHQAEENAADDWASGANGYLKKSNLVKIMQKAGFEFVGSSDINLNPLDKPTDKEFVWRLPPTYATSQGNPELMKQFDAIGESNRMTLTFKKPEK